jgi:two-component system, chemotaxis family, response regulator Rcp1
MAIASQPTAMPCILMIDDNPGDAELMRIAFEMSALDIELVCVTDGHAAVRELHRRCADGCPPALILLDLNLPRMHGAEVLARLDVHGSTPRIPVVVLSTSGQPSDRARLLQAGASEFYLKPDGIRDLVALVGSLRRFIGNPTA